MRAARATMVHMPAAAAACSTRAGSAACVAPRAAAPCRAQVRLRALSGLTSAPTGGSKIMATMRRFHDVACWPLNNRSDFAP